jgi:hypothetical protein
VRDRGAASPLSSLRKLAREAIGYFVRILGRCGLTPQEIVSAVREECERIPRHWAAEARRAPPEISDASHVLTAWFNQAAYLDVGGKPRLLPFEGAAPSFVTLVRSVDRQLDPREVLTYLIRARAVRRKGTRYVPRKRMLLLPGKQGPGYFHTLRTLNNFLRTLAHNLHHERTDPPLFEYSAENSYFPVSKLQQLDEYVNSLGGELLPRVDRHMWQREKMRRKGEPTVRLGLGMYVWRDPVSAASRGRRSRKLNRPRRS